MTSSVPTHQSFNMIAALFLIDQRSQFKMSQFLEQYVMANQLIFHLCTPLRLTRDTQLLDSYWILSTPSPTELCSWAFLNAGPRLGNFLPSSVCSACSLRSVLKSYLFQIAYPLFSVFWSRDLMDVSGSVQN